MKNLATYTPISPPLMHRQCSLHHCIDSGISDPLYTAEWNFFKRQDFMFTGYFIPTLLLPLNDKLPDSFHIISFVVPSEAILLLVRDCGSFQTIYYKLFDLHEKGCDT